MNLLHKTVIPRNDILFCTICKVNSSETTEVIMIYRHRVEISTIKYISSNQKISYHCPRVCPIEVPLIWAAASGDNLCTITEFSDFIISDLSRFPNFRQTFCIKLEKLKADYHTKAISWNSKYICLATDKNDIIIVNLTNVNSSPEFSVLHMPLESTIIINVIPAPGDSNFGIFVKILNNDKKCLYILDASTGNFEKTSKIDDSINQIIYSIDSGEHQLFSVSKRRITSLSGSLTCSVQSDINIVSNISENTVSAFLSDGTCYCHNFVSKYSVAYEKVSDFTKIFTMPKSILILFANDYFIILKMPKVQSHKKTVKSFTELQQIEILHYTDVKEMAFVNNKLYALGDFGLSAVTNQDSGELDTEINKFTSAGKLIMVNSELQYYTTIGNKTIGFKNGSQSKQIKFIHDIRTIDMYLSCGGLVQITPSCIYLNGKKAKEEKKILFSGCYENFISIINGNNEISLFSGNFDTCEIFSFQLFGADISALGMCKFYFALACFDEKELNKGSIFLLDYELNSFGLEVEIPSPVDRILILQNGKELFVFSKNGTIMKINADPKAGLTNQMSYIYFGAKPENVIKMGENAFSFIADSVIMIYIRDHIVSTGISEVITIGFDSKNLLFVQETIVGESKPKYLLYTVDPFEFDDSHVAIPPSNTQRPALHFMEVTEGVIFLLRDNGIYAHKTINKKSQASFALHKPKSFTSTQKKSGVYYVIVTHMDESKLTVLKFKNNFFVLLFEKTYSDKIYAVTFYRNLALMSIGNHLNVSKIHKKSFKFMRSQIDSTTPITHICENNNYIWTVHSDERIAVYQYHYSYDRFSIVAEEISQKKVTVIRPIDEITVAIGEKSGEITFYQIPLNSAIGSCGCQQRFSLPQENSSIPPKLKKVFYGNTKDQISSFLMLPNCILYSTNDGTIGAFIHGLPFETLVHLQEVQQKIRNLCSNVVGFSQKSRSAMCNSLNIVDYDLIDFYQRYIDPENKDGLLDFYDVALITKVLQILTF